MTIEELVDSHGVTLAYFDNELWQRPVYQRNQYYLYKP